MTKRILSLLLAAVLLLAFAPAAMAGSYQPQVQTVNDYTPLAGSTTSKINNVRLAAQAVNGVYIPYGSTFSFNDIVGPRTKANGYKRAENGRGAWVYGGGVAQVATTLYLALLDVPGRIQFGPISTYGSRFTDNYVDDGDLAIITDDDTGRDLSFTNLADDMTISMWLDDNYLYCTLTLGNPWFSAVTPAPAAPTPPGWYGGYSQTLLASVSIYCGDEAGVLHNVKLAADCVYDTTLSKGYTFSFNDTVGPRTKANGFRNATNGRGVKTIGGGVAQVASVLWLAVKNMDTIAVMEKSTYGSKYNQSYVYSSADAILTDYNEGTDFAFRYIGSGSITIYTWLDGNVLYCNIYRN